MKVIQQYSCHSLKLSGDRSPQSRWYQYLTGICPHIQLYLRRPRPQSQLQHPVAAQCLLLQWKETTVASISSRDASISNIFSIIAGALSCFYISSLWFRNHTLQHKSSILNEYSALKTSVTFRLELIADNSAVRE